jgi:hypothetical protein
MMTIVSRENYLSGRLGTADLLINAAEILFLTSKAADLN